MLNLFYLKTYHKIHLIFQKALPTHKPEGQLPQDYKLKFNDDIVLNYS